VQPQAREKGSELVYGYHRLQKILEQYADMAVLPFDETVLLRTEALASHHLQIGALDIRIAATALCHGFILLTAK
jgi:predicted nucleic acid-binding protein